MNDRITAGAAALTASVLVGTGMVRLAVWWPQERSKPRGRRVSAVLTDDSLADELLGPWPERPYGALVATAWRSCPACGHTTAGAVHADGTWTCGKYVNHPTGVA